uniref:Uncharacterized protein n=1 Tax=Arundo donax TaxID=35708 RepID=A0A0A9B1W3_ARUDO
MAFQTQATSISRSCFIRHDDKQKPRANTQQGWYLPPKSCFLPWVALCCFALCYITKGPSCPH